MLGEFDLLDIGFLVFQVFHQVKIAVVEELVASIIVDEHIRGQINDLKLKHSKVHFIMLNVVTRVITEVAGAQRRRIRVDYLDLYAHAIIFFFVGEVYHVPV